MTVPRFNQSWTQQMGEWLVKQTAGMPHDVEGGFCCVSTVQGFIEDHWDDICASWGCKDKWFRVVGCLFVFDWVQEEPEWVDQMNRAAQCWAQGHDIVDVSTAGPDSGNMDHECKRCGQEWRVPLY